MARLAEVLEVHDVTTKTDVGHLEGTSWTLSSAKARHGVAQLMSDDLDTLWQSDGAQPHTIDIHFPRRTAVTVRDLLTQHVSVFLDCHRDDSYTPTRLLVRAGTHPYDLVDVRYREFVEPQGWYHFLLAPPPGLQSEELDATAPERRARPLDAVDVFVLQVCVLGNHLNGKDTHIRCLKVFGPPDPHARSDAPAHAAAAPSTEHLVQQGLRNEAFRRQVERVGYDRAVAQLRRIVEQEARGGAHDHARPPPPSSTVQRSFLTLAHTLR